MHILTLLQRKMQNYQISCGDNEMAKRWLGREINICMLGNVFSIIYYLKIIKKNKLS